MTGPKSYQRLSRVAKLAYALDRIRDSPIVCPGCSMSVLPRDLEAHQARCGGRAWADQLADLLWIPWREIRALGIAWADLFRWTRRRVGPVRRKLVAEAWLYNRADVIRELEQQQGRKHDRSEDQTRARQRRWVSRKRRHAAQAQRRKKKR